MRGIYTTDQAQIIFFDTAGIHQPRDKLGAFMVDAARLAFEEADIIYAMVETELPGKREQELLAQVSAAEKTTFLVINKADLVKKDVLIPVIDHYSKLMAFNEIVPISALDGDNVEKLLALTLGYLPESPPYYPEDILSDRIERDFIAEYIREQVFLNTKDEIPYSTAVLIDDMKERAGGGAFISATIYLEKDSQKGILIGKGGAMIKKIGRDARAEIEHFLGYPVYLDLYVKIQKKWRKDGKALKRFGYR